MQSTEQQDVCRQNDCMNHKKKSKAGQVLSSAFWQGTYGYALSLILFLACRMLGWQTGSLMVPATFAAAAVLASLLVLAGLRLGLDRRLGDSHLAFTQCLAAVLFTTAMLPFLAPDVRPLLALLPLLWLANLFRYLNRRKLGLLVLTVFVGYPLASFDLLQPGDSFSEPMRQFLYWLVLLSLYGSFVPAMRYLRRTGVLFTKQRSRLHELERQLADLALQDPLTYAYKRNQILRIAEQEKSRLQRYGGTLSFALLAIDGLADINRSRDYQAGDQVIRHVAEALQSGLRKSDHLGRLRGRHFLVIMPSTDITGAQECAERLHVRITSRKVPTHSGELEISVTGAAIQQTEKDSVAATIQQLEDAVERIAKAGGNRIETL